MTFDNATELTNVTSGISLTDLNIALDSVPAFTYVIGLADFLFIGGLDSGADGVTIVTDDFTLAIELTPTGTPTSAGLFIRNLRQGVLRLYCDSYAVAAHANSRACITHPARPRPRGHGRAPLGQRKAS